MGFEEASTLWGWKFKAGSGWGSNRRREFSLGKGKKQDLLYLGFYFWLQSKGVKMVFGSLCCRGWGMARTAAYELGQMISEGVGVEGSGSGWLLFYSNL
ncbi:hypothetical protein L7F22_010345 [Adiantum nelumboides]|nr:hypothetical protein [Adiantum nelumboides]